MSHRIFVALRPPPPVREALKPLMGGIEGARWQNDNQLHLTLAFLGETDRHGVEAVMQALETVEFRPLELKLGQLGSFDADRADRTAAIWIGVEPAIALAELSLNIRMACRRVGIEAEARRFVPHITLARFGKPGANRETIRPWLETATPPAIGWLAESFHLVESYLGSDGAHYDPVAAYELVNDED